MAEPIWTEEKRKSVEEWAAKTHPSMHPFPNSVSEVAKRVWRNKGWTW